MNDDLPVWQQPESRRLEFKEIFPSGNQIAKTVIAFANGAGGRIVFGIRDNPREISGIPDEGIFHLEERIAQHIADQCAPLINYIHPLLQDQLISLTIPDKPKSPRQKYVLTGKGQDELGKLGTAPILFGMIFSHNHHCYNSLI